MEKSKIESQKNSIDKSTDEYKFYASASGKIHLNMPLNKGMVIQGGNTK